MRDDLPDNFESLEEFWRFWDTHSSADYEDAMTDETFDVDVTSSDVMLAARRQQEAEDLPEVMQPLDELRRRLQGDGLL